MKIRLIKNTKVSPEMFMADHEIDYDVPTLFCGFPENTFLMLTGKYKPEKYLHVDKIPKDIKIIRVPVPKKTECGAICYFKDTIKIDLHIPKEIMPATKILKGMFATAIKTLKMQTKNKDFSPYLKGNDLLIDVDGKQRKFCGGLTCELMGWNYVVMPITFKMDYDLMEKIYKKDTEKMKKKGKINNMTDVVIGLKEISDTFDKEEFLTQFIKNLAIRFDWDIEEGEFSEREKQDLNSLLPVISSEKWINSAEEYIQKENKRNI